MLSERLQPRAIISVFSGFCVLALVSFREKSAGTFAHKSTGGEATELQALREGLAAIIGMFGGRNCSIQVTRV